MLSSSLGRSALGCAHHARDTRAFLALNVQDLKPRLRGECECTYMCQGMCTSLCRAACRFVLHVSALIR